MRTDIFTEDNGVKRYDVQKIFGKGYNNGLFFNFKGRYRFFVGSRSSKKSQNMLGYEPILKILSDPRRNIVMCRQNDVDNKNSTYANLIKCIEDLGMTNDFAIRKQPLEIEYKRTGQMIIFKGLNNPTSITSSKFPHGELTDIYIEEAYECQNFDDFLKLDGSLRVGGDLAKEINIQITCVMNPWSPDHWIFTEFFKGRLEPTEEYMETHKFDDCRDDDFVGPFGKGLYLHQSNYKINEFRDKESWDPAAIQMKERSPELYKPNFLGLFGATTGLAYPEYSTACHVTAKEVMDMEITEFAIGIDTGLSNGEGGKITVKKGEDPDLKIRSATTMALIGITRGYGKVVVVDEYFHSNDKSSNQSNTDNQEELKHPELIKQCILYLSKWMNKYGSNQKKGNLLMKGTVNVYIDNADIATRQGLEMEANRVGLYNVNFMGSTKKHIQTRVDFTRILMAYDSFKICAENCPNAIREYRSARKGEKGEARAPGNDHEIDSIDYGSAPFYNELVLWKTFKEH